jgi:hypothetical protein
MSKEETRYNKLSYKAASLREIRARAAMSEKERFEAVGSRTVAEDREELWEYGSYPEVVQNSETL